MLNKNPVWSVVKNSSCQFGRKTFWQQKNIKSKTSYFRITIKNQDEVSWQKNKIRDNYLNENDKASNQCQRIHKKLLMLSEDLGSYPGRQLKSPSDET